MNETIIKYYKDELGELLSHHKVENIYDIANVHDRTQAIAYDEFIEKLSERQTTTEPNNNADTKQLIIADVINLVCEDHKKFISPIPRQGCCIICNKKL